MVWMLNSFTAIIAVVDWNEADMLHADFGLTDVDTPRPQTPPSGMAEVPTTSVDFSQR